jgi:hypothetical protein
MTERYHEGEAAVATGGAGSIGGAITTLEHRRPTHCSRKLSVPAWAATS